ncbi:sensor histidine kinase [Bradyrhizobium guangdongense]|uniref:histidine kinase n=1 Tax=Bradyrhizobium guangdongense TaxID=1325090 RepID=A0A410V0R8_9BRAD|nr:ATP-binding protein [Bradyrhizobium guangdongense]QAU37247.1 PAS domain-containing sensor histidine kinase [Bradyrhizobium guangdongense]QOZ58302.1 PAS domain-containing sensor histidine kinase [Bradyrhizobium guangdongense]GGI20799.1 PAS domain-containing sensor histidine kinase [Bradyrhizobium guangdongense]
MPKATHSPEASETDSLLKLVTSGGAIEFDREREGAWIEVIRKMDEVYSDLLRYEVDLEHKNAELEEAQAFVTNVIESVSDILVVCDARGLVQQVNSAFQHAIGRSVGDVVGKNIADVIDAADSPKLVPLLKPRGTPDVVDGELRFLTDGGSTDLFAINSSPRHDHRGRFIGVVLTGRPIGELRRAYEALHKAHHELQRAQRQLVEQEKMASLGRLVAGVAHELNNPISFVYGNIHTLIRYRAAIVAYLDAIHGEGRASDLAALRKSLRIDDVLEDFGPLIEGTMEGAVRISEIVKNLRRLSFSKLGEVERVNIERLINTAVLWAVRTKQVRIDLQMELEPELWISGNEGQLHQVIVNLVENAIDAMRGTEAPRLVVSAARKGNEVLFRISDNGPGIDKDHISHIFEPFFTTKRVGEGTGLGLWISYGIVREHGGELVATNEPEGGATFSFALPQAIATVVSE